MKWSEPWSFFRNQNPGPSAFKPSLIQLEDRSVPSVVAGPESLAAPIGGSTASKVASATASAAVSLGDRMVAYLATVAGKRVGGGECGHCASEALRIAGAKFIFDNGSSLDYVWGSLVAKVTGKASGAIFSNPNARFKPGDVLQYSNAKFSTGQFASHHTSVVASVESLGRVSAVYEQNFNNVRTCGKHALDLRKLTSGYIKVYRPQARIVTPTRFEFSVVNNAKTTVSVKEAVGNSSFTYKLTAGNSAASYQTRFWTTTGSKPTITVAGRTLTLEKGAGYEIYRTSAGTLSIRKLAK